MHHCSTLPLELGRDLASAPSPHIRTIASPRAKTSFQLAVKLSVQLQICRHTIHDQARPHKLLSSCKFLSAGLASAQKGAEVNSNELLPFIVRTPLKTILDGVGGSSWTHGVLPSYQDSRTPCSGNTGISHIPRSQILCKIARQGPS